MVPHDLKKQLIETGAIVQNDKNDRMCQKYDESLRIEIQAAHEFSIQKVKLFWQKNIEPIWIKFNPDEQRD